MIASAAAPVAASARVSVELVRFPGQSTRAEGLFGGLIRTAGKAGVQITATTRYRGRSDWLLLWGPGAPDRIDPMRRQLAAGGHVLACDLAYWDRQRKVRVSIDAAHPQAWVMTRDWPRDRWQADGLRTEDAWNPDGPVLLAGIGEKARVQYGAAVEPWEARIIAECRRRGRTVVLRPKPRVAAIPIDQALRGCGVCVTWHSNVAVDAIRLGIPVICQDGAAAAVCASDLSPDTMPHPLDPTVRDRFLANLAYFQWAPTEAAGCWRFLRTLLT